MLMVKFAIKRTETFVTGTHVSVVVFFIREDTLPQLHALAEVHGLEGHVDVADALVT